MKYRELCSGREFTFDDWFNKQTEEMEFFLVTRIRELTRQNECMVVPTTIFHSLLKGMAICFPISPSQ